MQRHPHFTLEQLMVVVNISTEELRHSRAAQELIEEGQADGRRAEAASITLRQLSRRCGSLDQGSRERLSSLTLQQLEQLAEDLLDFTVPGDLQTWFDDHPAG